MRTKIKKLIPINSMPLLALTLLILSGLALAATREPISISGAVDLATFTGTATVTIRSEQLSGSVMVVPLAPPVPKDDGLYFPVVQHVFAFEDGSSLTTTGEELAMPTDENPWIATLHGNMEIILGTGVFDSASGELRVNGQMDWPPISGQATFNAKGTICR